MKKTEKPRSDEVGLVLCVFLCVALTYMLLIAEVPVDDEASFVGRVARQALRFDLAYPWLLPFLQLVVDAFESIASPLAVLKAVNVISASAGFSIFALTLRRSGLSTFVACMTILFAALSFNFVSLAPTGHPKMLSFPFLCGALHFAVEWERQQGLRVRKPLVFSGILLGIASLFLVNSLVVTPFGVMVIFLRQKFHASKELWSAVNDAVIWAFLAVGVFLLGLLLAALVQGLHLENLGHLLESKSASGGSSENLTVMFARAVFATVFGIIGLQGMGSTIRAVMAGLVDDYAKVVFGLLPSLLAFVLVGMTLSWVYFRAITLLVIGRTLKPIGFPLAFIVGFVVFGIFWQLNEAEFWYQIIAPTYLIASLVVSSPLGRRIFAGLLVFVVLYNLLYFSIPRRNYPLDSYRESAASRYTANDLVLYFSAYPGRPTFSFIAGGVRSKVSVDELFLRDRAMSALILNLGLSIDRSLQTGGEVHVFEIFDEDNWDAPWLSLIGKGFDRRAFMAEMHGRYCIERLGEQYGLKVWSIEMRSACKD